MSEENAPYDPGAPPDFYPCEGCGRPVLAERAFAAMQTLDVFCEPCFLQKLNPCEGCGTLIHASAYQHLPTGKVLCEACVLKRISS